MSATVPMLRWSSTRDCPRKAVYEAVGAPARERTRREQGILWRGKSIGRDFVVFLAHQETERAGKPALVWVDAAEKDWVPARFRARSLSEASFVAEKKVVWPLGIAHEDVFVRDTGTVVEVLSSAHASDAMIHSKLLQLVGQIEHDEEATNGALVVLSPSDFTEVDRFLVSKDSDAYRELAAEAHERVRQVLAWRDTGELPVRVCGKPGDAWGHFCLHADHCFDGWEAPELDPVEDPLVHELAISLYRAKQDERAAKERLAECEEKRKAVQDQLAEHLEEGAHEVGSLTVTRRVTHRSATLDLKKARLAVPGWDELVADFMKPGAVFSTWLVDRHGDAPLLVPGEWDEVPF